MKSDTTVMNMSIVIIEMIMKVITKSLIIILPISLKCFYFLVVSHKFSLMGLEDESKLVSNHSKSHLC
jgi:hypothetical protein